MSMGTWKLIALDFIVKLLKSKKLITKIVYNLILVITNKFTKYRYFILYKTVLLAKNLAYTFYKYVVANYEIPKEIISNHNKLFTFKFWKSLMDLVDIKYNLLTFYHLQTNNQTKQLNQTLKQYLQCYINYQQND